MNDWTAAQAAEKWGLTVRRVQTLCIAGRIPGAWKQGRQWMIPSGMNKPEDLRQTREQTNYLPYVMMTSSVPYGAPVDGLIPDAITDEKLRQQYSAEIAYFRGDFYEAEKLFHRVKPEDPNFICACTIEAVAAVSRGDSEGFHRAMEALGRVRGSGNPEAGLLAEIAKATCACGMILPEKAPKWIRTGEMDMIPQALRIHTIYLRTRYLQSICQYDSMLATAQTAITMLGSGYEPLNADIYLRLCCSVALVQLGRMEEAEAWLIKAMRIGIPRGLIAPFAELGSTLEGMLDKCLRREYPEYEEPINRLWDKIWKNWASFHNEYSDDEIALLLSARETQIAYKAIRGLSNAEIAKDFSISIGRVKNILSEIYTKLGVSGRIELAEKIVWNRES